VTAPPATLDAYLAQPGPRPAATQGNTEWAAATAVRMADILRRYSARRPRSLQRHLGPSELGVECDRQVVGKLLGLPATNHVVDPWPSFMGTAGHAELDAMFQWENTQLGAIRYLPERRVNPGGVFAEHPGTGDLYDAWEACMLDHKLLGSTSMDIVKSPGGPPRKYVGQLGLYGLGYMQEGLPVRRIALLAWPRTGSSLSGLYVWEHAMDAQMAQLLHEIADDTVRRKRLAAAIAAAPAYAQGPMWAQVERTPDHHECYFCSFYRPNQDGPDDGVGCPGTVT
jgi:hypothetical protein